jgi:arylsulfatase A-like enzyme
VNYIIIVCDTFRRDFLGCYGNDSIDTRHIDAFAETSLVFDRAYSASFPTVPHRRDLLTGRFTFTYTPWAALSPDETVLADVLSKSGLTTMMVCDCPHILEDGYNYDRGFDAFEWIRGQETDRWKTHPRDIKHPAQESKIRAASDYFLRHRRSTAHRRHEKDTFVALTMTEASEWLEHNYDQGEFFLYVDAFDPHEPWDAPKWYVEKYDPGYAGQVSDYPKYAFADEFLTKDELKHVRALYAGEVTLVDRWVGRLLDKIGDLGLFDNTVVIFTTDHGFLHGEHGIVGKSLIEEGVGFAYIPLYEEINHIPMIASFPGRKAGRTRAVVQPPDIMPTILTLQGVEIPESVQGVSFDRVLRGEKDAFREWSVSAPYLAAPTAMVTVNKGPWAAVLCAKRTPDGEAIDRAVDGQEKRVRRGRIDYADQLYNVEEDPRQERFGLGASGEAGGAEGAVHHSCQALGRPA